MANLAPPLANLPSHPKSASSQLNSTRLMLQSTYITLTLNAHCVLCLRWEGCCNLCPLATKHYNAPPTPAWSSSHSVGGCLHHLQSPSDFVAFNSLSAAPLPTASTPGCLHNHGRMPLWWA